MHPILKSIVRRVKTGFNGRGGWGGLDVERGSFFPLGYIFKKGLHIAETSVARTAPVLAQF